MAEIEIKILGIDVDKVAERLASLGARPLFSGIVRCRHFDLPGETLRKSHCLFRLRRWEGESGFSNKFEICYKGSKQIIDGCKVREEIETTVADADQFETMMMKLGYHVTLNNDKRRRSYELNGAHFDLDEYPTAPAYMEIEAPDREGIDRAVKAVGLEQYEQSTETANELFARLWPEIDFDHLKLPK
ncbi:MAG: class IV adenylate cyclase [Candidatus Gracilibacteria bacterium]